MDQSCGGISVTPRSGRDGDPEPVVCDGSFGLRVPRPRHAHETFSRRRGPMRRFILITLVLMALAAPALAQPPRFGEVAQALYANAHLTATSSDDAKRVVTIQLAE